MEIVNLALKIALTAIIHRAKIYKNVHNVQVDITLKKINVCRTVEMVNVKFLRMNN